jgi:hypothetical protein
MEHLEEFVKACRPLISRKAAAQILENPMKIVYLPLDEVQRAISQTALRNYAFKYSNFRFDTLCKVYQRGYFKTNTPHQRLLLAIFKKLAEKNEFSLKNYM